MTWWRRVLRRRTLERELDAELRDHIEREIAAGVRAGASEADVRRQIRLTSGGRMRIPERVASSRNAASRSVLPSAKLMQAAMKTSAWFAFIHAVW